MFLLIWLVIWLTAVWKFGFLAVISLSLLCSGIFLLIVWTEFREHPPTTVFSDSDFSKKKSNVVSFSDFKKRNDDAA